MPSPIKNKTRLRTHEFAVREKISFFAGGVYLKTHPSGSPAKGVIPCDPHSRCGFSVLLKSRTWLQAWGTATYRSQPST